MIYQLSAACGCQIGNVRKNNEDNFFFNGVILREKNDGMSGVVSEKKRLENEICYAVFDGMGGEEFGEKASFAAASTTKEKLLSLREYADSPRPFLELLCKRINQEICAQQKELAVVNMGTTGAFLLFVPDEAYACNLGDSRIYRLRDNELSQISVDDAERLPPGMLRKPRLTQFLGVPEDELQLEPHIVKCSLHAGDIFLICSDGLSDMLSNIEICMTLKEHTSVKRMVQHLLSLALQKGGKDNVTVLVVKID